LVAVVITARWLRLTGALLARIGLTARRHVIGFALACISTIGLALRTALGLHRHDPRVARMRAIDACAALSRRTGKFCEGVFLADQAREFGERVLTAASARIIHTLL
jgi:hypothetical protein